MKKYVFMLVMLFTMSVYSFADDSNATPIAKTEKYDLKVNYRRLGVTLGMSADQMEMSEMAIEEFSRDLVFAEGMDTEESRNKIVANALRKNLTEMRGFLSAVQFRKYLTLLNLTLRNKGFDMNEISK